MRARPTRSRRTSSCYAATTTSFEGRVDEAVAEARFAVERDPVSALPRFSLAQVVVAARRFEEAIPVAHAAIQLDPSFPSSYQALGWGLVGLGRYDEAVEACRQQVIVYAPPSRRRSFALQSRVRSTFCRIAQAGAWGYGSPFEREIRSGRERRS